MVPMLIKAVGHPSVTQPAIIAGNSKYVSLSYDPLVIRG
jgi:hypothetical protein